MDYIDHYRLKAEILNERTTHVKEFSDATKGIRRAQRLETWLRKRELGRGGFGEVHLEQEEQSGSLRAVKVLREQPSTTQATTRSYLKELSYMAYFSKDKACFPELYGWYQVDRKVFIAMEYFEHGDLWQSVSKPLPEESVRLIMFQIAEALCILHEKGLTHRDVKPQVMKNRVERVTNQLTVHPECSGMQTWARLVGQVGRFRDIQAHSRKRYQSPYTIYRFMGCSRDQRPY